MGGLRRKASKLAVNRSAARLNKSSEVVPYGVRDVWLERGIDDSVRAAVDAVVFVIDSGVSDQTGDLNLSDRWSRSWIAGESPFLDGIGHGTHVAGTIAAAANRRGIVGVAPNAEVISLKVVDQQGQSAPFESFLEAIDYAWFVVQQRGLSLDRVVVNISMGAPASAEMEEAVRQAADRGLRFALSAGNLGMDVDQRSPANAGDHPNVYTVAAYNRFHEIADWSNWDVADAADPDDVDGAAPGVGVLSYSPDGSLIARSGSSMAAAHVAGALLLGDLVIAGNAEASRPERTEPMLRAASAVPLAPQPEALLAEPLPSGRSNRHRSARAVRRSRRREAQALLPQPLWELTVESASPSDLGGLQASLAALDPLFAVI